MKKILVVDDEKPISDIVKFSLSKEGFEVVTAFDGEEGLAVFAEENPDLVILDLMLPKIEGLEVCREIRKTSNVPIIMVTAKDSEIDKVLGLELGADDYVTKPFSNRELIARVKAKITKSGFSAAKTANPSSPSNAVTTSKPSFDKLNLTMSEIGFSSSTTKIFFITSSSLAIERLGNIIYYPKHLLKC